MKREIPLYTLSGVSNAEVSTHYFTTGDGLGLSLLRFNRDPHNDAGDSVMIVHGLTTSTDMFVMPEHENLVTHLLDNGFTDVWCLDFRMSNRHSYNLFPHRYTFDDVALYDFPAAVRTIRERIGARRLHVVTHCLGAVTFLFSLFGKAVDDITSVVANSAGLTLRVPAWSHLKLRIAPELVEYALGLPYLSPTFPDEPRGTRGHLLSRAVSIVHPECDVPGCHMLSMMWGAGWPALYRHENLADVTHRRGADLYGATSMHYYRHVRKLVRAGSRPLKFDPTNADHDALPDDYFVYAREITTPILFTTGDRNRVFADSNVVCHARLAKLGAHWHELKVFPGYGHQDVFMGAHAARDCFPSMLDFMRRASVVATGSRR